MMFSAQDQKRISAAIKSAEAATSGEIVVIVSTQPQRYLATALSLAALLALALPLVALLAGWSPSGMLPDWDMLTARDQERRSLETLIVLQSLVFGATMALGWFTPLGRILTPQGLRRDRVHRAALSQFHARGLNATTGRTGVLLYVDEPDHIAEIIADTAVFEKVAAEHWADTIDALTDGIKSGTPVEGLVAAIDRAGHVLTTHFPPLANDRNELPDHLIEI